jgi:hypothetical protein
MSTLQHWTNWEFGLQLMTGDWLLGRSRSADPVKAVFTLRRIISTLLHHSPQAESRTLEDILHGHVPVFLKVS